MAPSAPPLRIFLASILALTCIAGMSVTGAAASKRPLPTQAAEGRADMKSRSVDRFPRFRHRLSKSGRGKPTKSAPQPAPDTTPPAVTLTAPRQGSSTGLSPSFSGAAGTEAGDQSAITIRIYSGSSATGTPARTLNATAAAGNWSAQPSSPLDPGTYTALASQSDQAGNTGQSPAATLTATAPSAPAPSCSLGTFGPGNNPGACWRPYADSSPFNTRVAASPRIAASSAEAVNRWVGFWSASSSASYTYGPYFSVGTADSTADYDHPIYYSEPSDPTYTVHCTRSWGTCEIEGMKVQIPAAARPAGGGDGHMSVIDQVSGWEYDFWQVESKASGGGTITVSWGGRTRVDGDGLGSNSTAAHFGGAAGVIRPSELLAGEIDHALFMVVKCTNGQSVHPAGTGVGRTCASMGLPNAGAPPMGAHFFLDMTDAEIDAAPVPAWKKTIMRAAAHYGLFVGDTGGGFIKLESGSSFTSFGHSDPWAEIAREAGIPAWTNSTTGNTQYRFDLRTGIDWSGRMRMLAP